MKRLLYPVTLWFLTAFAAVAQMASQQVAKPGDNITLEIRTHPGNVFQSREDYVISEKGTIKLPGLPHEIPAHGVPFDQLALQINEAYIKSGTQPVSAVKGIGFAGEGCCNHVLMVGGEVLKPGEYPLRQGMTLTAAIGKAGGFASNADISKVELIRAKQEMIYDLRAIKPDGSNNPVLMDGDEIVVQASSEKPDGAALLNPGDTVLIALKEPASDSHKITMVYTVSDQGTIKLPLLKQEIPAWGLSLATLARNIELAYVKEGIFKSPLIQATLPPLTKISENSVAVAGEVQSAGEYPWTMGMTLRQAIQRAGGITELAQISRVKIVRAGKVLVYDLREIKPDESNNPMLMDGDQIIVPTD